MVPHLLEHAQGAAGVRLAAHVATALASSATKAVVADARAAAHGRVMQSVFNAPRTFGPGASLAIELSADGKQQRFVASAALAPLIPTLT
jgi:uncharacterized protein (DUF697 family)